MANSLYTMDPKNYVEKLQEVIRHLQMSESIHLGAELIQEKVNGKVIWQQTVELFELTNNAQAKRCYAWRDASGHYRAVVHRGPVRNAKDAIKYALLTDGNRAGANENASRQFMEAWRQFRLRLG